ncbi:MAG: RNA polymerase sigma factor [Clostridia bacterium]|nr:RNA polymerase sigma factor [Clostridia bacterium]
MNKNEAERIIEEMTKPVFAFCLKRCKTTEDAEDLSQEILFRSYRALTVREDVADPEKYVWCVAHNSLANYYRDSRGGFVGIQIDDFAETLGVWDEYFKEDDSGTIERMRREIAYLSKIQRRIVIAYYYEGKKQQEIASELSIPAGTVKWHLFEAKRELKKGMEKMRDKSELKFNPVKFAAIGYSGDFGCDDSPRRQLDSALAQNIVYAAQNTAMTVNELADALGVSPVYVESEAEALEYCGHLIKKGDRYLGNVLINEPTDNEIRTLDEVYESAAALIAGELFDEIEKSGMLEDGSVKGGVRDPETGEKFDKNYFMWSLFLNAEAQSEYTDEMPIRFEDVATIRPNGGIGIYQADVVNPGVRGLKYSDSLGKWFGPQWNGSDADLILWTIDSEWTGYRLTQDVNVKGDRDELLLKKYLAGGEFSKEELAYLAERGFIGISPSGRHALRCVCIDKDAKRKLEAIGSKVKKKYAKELSALKDKCCESFLETTPEHMKLVRKCLGQYIFSSDGLFLLYSAKKLVADGKLIPPAEDEKSSAVILLIKNA